MKNAYLVSGSLQNYYLDTYYALHVYFVNYAASVNWFHFSFSWKVHFYTVKKKVLFFNDVLFKVT